MVIDLFLGKPTVFWSGLEAIGIIVTALVLAITGWFVLKQVRIAIRTFQFNGILDMQKLIDEFREDRYKIFSTFPIELVLSSKQFLSRPPGRLMNYKISESERYKTLLTKKQTQALNSLNKEQFSIARRVIGKLNDLGQLAEDGFVNYKVLLGKYHIIIIKLCHFLEPIRRKIEEQEGGNYGQRLLRMRHTAIIYNMIYPRHRNVDIKIFTPNGSKTIITATKGPLIRRFFWYFKRHFFLT